MHKDYRTGERGGASVKLLVVLAILFLAGRAGYVYVPVAYQGENFKQEMQAAVIQGVALPVIGKTPIDAVRDRLKSAARLYDLPSDTVVDVKQINNIVQARVHYVQKVEVLPFGLYTRDYEFNHVATPTGFLTKN